MKANLKSNVNENSQDMCEAKFLELLEKTLDGDPKYIPVMDTLTQRAILLVTDENGKDKNGKTSGKIVTGPTLKTQLYLQGIAQTSGNEYNELIEMYHTKMEIPEEVQEKMNELYYAHSILETLGVKTQSYLKENDYDVTFRELFCRPINCGIQSNARFERLRLLSNGKAVPVGIATLIVDEKFKEKVCELLNRIYFYSLSVFVRPLSMYDAWITKLNLESLEEAQKKLTDININGMVSGSYLIVLTKDEYKNLKSKENIIPIECDVQEEDIDILLERYDNLKNVVILWKSLLSCFINTDDEEIEEE